jgi:hypothetical protein
MLLRVLSALLGAGFLAFPFAPGAPREAWLAAMLGIAFIAYGFGGKRLLSKVAPRLADNAAANAPNETAHYSSFSAMFIANCRASMRNSTFMIFCVLAGVVIAWYYQSRFEVPRERQGDMFGRVWMLVVLLLLLSRAGITTLAQRYRRNRSTGSDA